MNLFTEELYYIDILHVYQKPKADAPHMPTTITDIQKNEEMRRMRFVADCDKRISDVLDKKLNKAALVNTHLIQGSFYKELKEHIRFHKYDLMVLLPGKKDGLELLLNGRNVLKIISNINIPILVLPKYSAFEFTKTVFVGMLENPKNQLKKFRKNKVLRQIAEKSIKYLHISKTGVNEEKDIKVLNNSSRISAFEKFHEERKTNYIYVLNHNPEKGFRKWKKSSFTKTVLAKSDASIMVI